MGSDEKPEKARSTLLAILSLKPTAQQISAADKLSIILGRLFLTGFACVMLGVTTVFLLWKPNGWSVGLEAVLTMSVGRCFWFYFGKGKK